MNSPFNIKSQLPDRSDPSIYWPLNGIDELHFLIASIGIDESLDFWFCKEIGFGEVATAPTISFER